ncbi:unnamed protein product [Symbiodinium necroappetens]|uniref:Apple domain-containing protein n=1 Tax=Symbiodinium necroappetens TaxID=1628268 RepID=A0A812M8N4_9DINO|nr:unnamed protein product [Symbiodinium sp. KB8]CAE7217723.1 unnamed protein product [Symbiodinium microadriaticum]CAE7258915.1 unnamed protein product [Symbiodinium necroappetens]
MTAQLAQCITFKESICVGPKGVDIDILNTSLPSADDCCKACSTSVECRGWTFKSGSCSLKSLCPLTGWPGDIASTSGATLSPPGPPIPSRCSAEETYGWPKFHSRAELLSSVWATYFERVYGAVPQVGYPICTWDFWYLDRDSYERAGIAGHPVKYVIDWLHGMNHVDVGDLYDVKVTDVNKGSYKNGLWIKHVKGGYGRKGYGAAGNHQWIEVRHQGGGVTGEEVGMWFLYAPGSGVWFNTGRTRVFETHAVAAEQLCGRQVGPNDATEMVRCAAEAGSLDSFQFQYDWDVPENVEIVAVNLQGVYPCGTAASGRVAAFRSGWMASSPCDCDNAARDGFLNCNLNQTVARVRGIGSSTSFATFHSEAVTSAVTGALVVSVALAVCTVFGKKIAGDPRPNVPHQDLSSAETCREYLLKIGWMMAQLLLAGVSLGIVS